MVKHEIDLPPYTVFRKRKSGAKAFYFRVPERLCPEGWLPDIALGRDDEKPIEDILKQAKELKKQLDQKRRDEQLGVVHKAAPGTFPDIVRIYKDSDFWTNLTKRTQSDYDAYISIILTWSKKAGNPHISTLPPKVIVGFLTMMGRRIEKDAAGKQTTVFTPKKRTRAKAVLSILYNIAVIEGFVDSNIVKKVKLSRIKKQQSRPISIWEEHHIAAFVARADAMGWGSVGTAVMIGMDTGQRLGDVLKMQKPRDFREGRFRFQQNKTSQEVGIKASAELSARLASLPASQMMLVRHETTGERWREDTFSHKLREIADSAGMPEHIFRHLRHSALLQAERADLSELQICHKFGWSRETVKAMRDEHYGVLHDEEIADSTVEKLENYRKAKAQQKG